MVPYRSSAGKTAAGCPVGRPRCRGRSRRPGSAPTRLDARISSSSPRLCSQDRTSAPARVRSNCSQRSTYSMTDGDGWPIGCWLGDGVSRSIGWRCASWSFSHPIDSPMPSCFAAMTASMAVPPCPPDQHRHRSVPCRSHATVTDGCWSGWLGSGQRHRRRGPSPTPEVSESSTCVRGSAARIGDI